MIQKQKLGTHYFRKILIVSLKITKGTISFFVIFVTPFEMSLRVALFLTFACCVLCPRVSSYPDQCRVSWKSRLEFFNFTQYIPLFAGSAAMAKKLRGAVFELKSSTVGLEIRIYFRDKYRDKCIHGEVLRANYARGIKRVRSMQLKGPELCDEGYSSNSWRISSGYLEPHQAFIRTCSEKGDQLEFVLMSCNEYERVSRVDYKRYVHFSSVMENDTFTPHEVNRDLELYSGYLTRDFQRNPGSRETDFCPVLWQSETTNEKHPLVFVIALLIIAFAIVIVTLLMKYYAKGSIHPIV